MQGTGLCSRALPSHTLRLGSAVYVHVCVRAGPCWRWDMKVALQAHLRGQVRGWQGRAVGWQDRVGQGGWAVAHSAAQKQGRVWEGRCRAAVDQCGAVGCHPPSTCSSHGQCWRH